MKYFFLAHIKINDPQEYQQYLDKARKIFSKYKGKYLAADSSPQRLEGQYAYTRSVLIEFESKPDFEDWYYSEDYQEALGHRLHAADCDSILIRGLE